MNSLVYGCALECNNSLVLVVLSVLLVEPMFRGCSLAVEFPHLVRGGCIEHPMHIAY